MSLGLPSHLAPLAVSRAFVRALHVTAGVFLGAGVIFFASMAVMTPVAAAIVPLVAILAIVAVLVLIWRVRTVWTTLVYLAVGGTAVFAMAVAVDPSAFAPSSPEFIPFSSAKIALVLVGGAGDGIARRMLWTIAGYVVAETAVMLSWPATGRMTQFDPATLAALVFSLGVLCLAIASRRASSRVQPSLHRAAHQEQIAAVRSHVEVKAAAMLHDTVLSHLAAVASSPAGVLQPGLREVVTRDFETILGTEWLAEDTGSSDHDAEAGWAGTATATAVEEARRLGLQIELTGDLGRAARLGSEAGTALGLAVKQCLVNVHRHSGTSQAEVAVYGAEGEITVMVIDAGRGFEIAQTGSDRLGLRQSVQRRMEAVGGSAQIWSTPGRGTSVMIRVPMTPSEECPEVTS